MNKKTIFFIILLVLIFLFILFRFRNKSIITQRGSDSSWVDCTSKITEVPEKKSGWTTKLYSAKLEESSTNNETVATNTRIFEIKKLTEKKDTESVYYRVQRENFPFDYATGSKVVIEVCNEKNQTPQWYSTKWDKIPETGEKISARVTHLHSTQQAFVPGKYRLDAYLYIDGKWHFTNRMDGVELK